MIAITKNCAKYLKSSRVYALYFLEVTEMLFNAKRTPEGSYSFVAQGSQCPERALLTLGKIQKEIAPPKRGAFNCLPSLKYPTSGVLCHSYFTQG